MSPQRRRSAKLSRGTRHFRSGLTTVSITFQASVFGKPPHRALSAVLIVHLCLEPAVRWLGSLRQDSILPLLRVTCSPPRSGARMLGPATEASPLSTRTSLRLGRILSESSPAQPVVFCGRVRPSPNLDLVPRGLCASLPRGSLPQTLWSPASGIEASLAVPRRRDSNGGRRLEGPNDRPAGS